MKDSPVRESLRVIQRPILADNPISAQLLGLCSALAVTKTLATPMRSHIFEQLEGRATERRISFWYGARSRNDLFYVEDFDRLQQKYDNFTWSVALSEPGDDADWRGATGFIHEHLRDAYLKSHPDPASYEYYLCGPPLMVRAVVAMLEQLGVDSSNIFHDDFGD